MRQTLIFAFMMALVTTGVISFSLVLLNVSMFRGFVNVWLRSWLISYPIALILILFIAPRIQVLSHFINDRLRK